MNQPPDQPLKPLEEFELLGARVGNELGKLIDTLGLEKLVFEVDSPKAGRDRWHRYLKSYVTLFGPECNVSNIMPSQAMFVELMRTGWAYDPIGHAGKEGGEENGE